MRQQDLAKMSLFGQFLRVFEQERYLHRGIIRVREPCMSESKASYDCLDCPGYCCSYPVIVLTKRDVTRLAKHLDLDFETTEKRFTRSDHGRWVGDEVLAGVAPRPPQTTFGSDQCGAAAAADL